MSNVGYATLSVIPSMQGFTSAVERELGPQLAAAGRSSGLTAGRETGKGITKGATEETKSTGIFSNVEKGAAVAGVGAGRRFGTALHETLGEYTKTIGATMVGFFAYEKVKEGLTEIITAGREAAATERDTEAVLKSTGEAAGVTADHITALSKAISSKSAIDADSIQKSENMLLTFKNVRDEAGKGNAIFDQASQAIVDLSARMAGSGNSGGGDSLKGAAIQVGKALNDPVKGLTALARVGVTFDAATKTRIKNLVAEGKTLEAQKIILGELKSEFGGAAHALADPVSQATADWKNLAAEIGKSTLPAINAVASGMSKDAIPALKASGEYVAQVAEGWSKLDGPVKAATLAFVAFKVASKFGAIDALTSSFSSLRAGVQLTAESYDTARLSQGRFASGFTALRQGASLTTDAMRRTIAGAAGVGIAMSGMSSSSNKALSALASTAQDAALGFAIGGPWGAAIGGAIGLLHSLAGASTKVADSEKAIKASVSTLTETLNQQTGAITRNTVETAKKNLADAGVFDAAKRMGVSLGDLTSAYLDNKDGIAAVGHEMQNNYVKRMQEGGAAMQGFGDDQKIVNNAIIDTNGALGKAREHLQETATATREMKDASKGSSGQMETYAKRTDEARVAVDKLFNIENKRRLATLQSKQDALSLIEQMQATAKEAEHGKKTLDQSTKAGQANMQSLIDLATQFDNSTKGVRNQKYDGVRKQFIDLATEMGGGGNSARANAKKLANQMLLVPKKLETKILTPGMKKALADLRELRILQHNAAHPTPISPNAPATPSWLTPGGGVTVIHNGDIKADDPKTYHKDMQRRHRRAASDGIRRG